MPDRVVSVVAGEAYVHPLGTTSLRAWALDVWTLYPLSTGGFGALEYVDATLLARLGPAPRIAIASAVAEELYLYLDAPMVPGVEYAVSLSASLPGFGNVTCNNVTGPRRSGARPEPGAIVDVLSPLVGASPGMALDASGDAAEATELQAVELAIWDLLLTRRGELYWDPSRGSPLALKELRPGDLRSEEAKIAAQIETLAPVSKAVVQLLWQDGHMVVSVRARTRAGVLTTSRRADDVAR